MNSFDHNKRTVKIWYCDSPGFYLCFLSFVALFSAHSCLTWLSHRRVMGRHVCSLVNFSPHFIKAVEIQHRATRSASLSDLNAINCLISKHPVQTRPLYLWTRARHNISSNKVERWLLRWTGRQHARIRGSLFSRFKQQSVTLSSAEKYWQNETMEGSTDRLTCKNNSAINIPPPSWSVKHSVAAIPKQNQQCVFCVSRSMWPLNRSACLLPSKCPLFEFREKLEPFGHRKSQN